MPLKRRITLLIIFILGTALTFWLVSRYPVLDSKAAMSGTEAFEDKLTHEAHFHVPDDATLKVRVLYTTLNWYETNWKGMAFGLVLAGAFLTLISYLPKNRPDQPFKNSFMGMFIGTPLGVCVNCVAPIAKGMYEAGSKMETALAVMFSSPTLNIVVLTMLFSIFPFYMALLKVGATFLLILLLVPLISKRNPTPPANEVCVVEAPISMELESWQDSLRAASRDYWKSFSYIVVRTVPLMLLAGFLGALMSHLWGFEKMIGLPVTIKSLALVSFMGTFIPVPIAFDLMLAQTLMMSKLADGFIVTLLFTLGTFSIYSALIIYRTFSLKLALQLYVIIFLLGIGLGMLGNLYSEYSYVRWLEQYDRYTEADTSPDEAKPQVSTSVIPEKTRWDLHPTGFYPPENFLKTSHVSVEFVPHRQRGSAGDKPFSQFFGPEWGISYSNKLTPKIFFDPLFFGRGIASGDLNGDGWTDIAVATDNGFELYQNIDGKKFVKLEGPLAEVAGKQGVSIALVDMNNDGALDVVLTTFNDGNYVWLNPWTGNDRVVSIANGKALLTSALTFGDVNRDGFLDMVQGNYFLGVITRTPMSNSVDQLVINRNLEFTAQDLSGIPGQTHSALLSDWNNDAILDLTIGNDYLVADTYYRGGPAGELIKILKQDGIVPVTTENTMSLDTADFNNDLLPDLYLANIGFSKGIDVVSNIFGDVMRKEGRSFCDSSASVLSASSCREILKWVTLMNPEKQDISERCSVLQDRRAVGDCMVVRLTLLAVKKNDPALCKKISDSHPMAQTVCQKFFEPERLEISRQEEIPMRSMSNVLLAGREDHTFEDVSKATGVGTAEWSWNARFADLDNDEWQDLYVVNGVLITQEFASNNFFHNEAGKKFSPAEKEFGLADRDHSSSYTYLDIDNDGDLDIIANTLYGPFKIYINNETTRHSVTFKLRDDRGNRFCIGCRVTIRYGAEGERHQMREIKAGGGFHSFDAPVAHFGLGEYDRLQKVEIRWSNGETMEFETSFPANREYTIHRKAVPATRSAEGTGR